MQGRLPTCASRHCCECFSPVCTTPDLRPSLYLVVSAQSLPSVLGRGARILMVVRSAVASCVSVGCPAEICGQKLLGFRERYFSVVGVGWVGL